MPTTTPLLNVVFVQRIIKYVSPEKINKPLELANVCQLWAETSSEWFAAAHVWKNVLAKQRVGTTVKLYMLMSMAAAHDGSAWIVHALTEAGISPRVGNPLNVACRYGHYDVCKMLLECSGKRGPETVLDFDHPDHGFTPLQHAVLYKDVALVKLLLDHRKSSQDSQKNFNLEAVSSTNEVCYENKTALQLAQGLEDSDDKIDDDTLINDEFIDEDGDAIKTALEQGTKSRKQIIVDLLLEAGAKLVGSNTKTNFPPSKKDKKSEGKVVKASPASCLKCKLKFLKGHQAYTCGDCDAKYCLVCSESCLFYSHRIGVQFCRPCSEERAKKPLQY